MQYLMLEIQVPGGVSPFSVSLFRQPSACTGRSPFRREWTRSLQTRAGCERWLSTTRTTGDSPSRSNRNRRQDIARALFAGDQMGHREPMSAAYDSWQWSPPAVL